MAETPKKSIPLVWIAFLVTLASFIQSYITCAIAGALPFIAREFDLAPTQEGHASSFLLLGGLAGSLTSGYLANRFGRKKCFFLAMGIYVASTSVSFGISSYEQLLIVRFITGLAVGLTMSLAPMYLAEIAPPAKRGAFVTLYQLSLTIGTFAAYGDNSYFTASGNWRAMFFSAAPLALFLFFALFSLPESPKWLAKKQGKTAPAPEAQSSASSPQKTHRTRLLLLIGIVLCVSQQLSGIGAVVYFTPKILKESGFTSDSQAILATLIMGVANCLATFLSLFLIDRVGRRTLLLTSQAGLIGSLVVFILSSLSENPWVDRFALICLMTFIFSYSLGLGPITWVLISEIYPIAIREKAMAFLTFLNGLSNYVVVFTFPVCCAQIGSPMTFVVYTVITLGAFLFSLRYVPETKGKSLEELEHSI